MFPSPLIHLGLFPFYQSTNYLFQSCLPTEFPPWEKKSNPIIAFLLSFCPPAILFFREASIHSRRTILPCPKRFSNLPLLKGWERGGPSFLSVNTISNGAGRSGLRLIHPVFDGQPGPWLHPHTLSGYYYAKQHHFLQPGPHTHTLKPGFVRQPLMRVIFEQMKNRGCKQTHLFKLTPL